MAAENVDVDEAPDPGLSVVLNALRDVVAPERRVLGNEASVERTRTAFEAAVPADRRDRFARVLTRSGRASGSDADTDDGVLTDVAAAVAAELADMGVTLRLEHEATVTVPDRAARLYTFMTARDREVIRPLDLPAAASEGIDAALAGAYGRAAQAFERAVEAAGAGRGAIATRSLAAWAHHLDSEDTRAMDFVEEALHLETDALGPKYVGLAADHRFPEKFRNGKLGVRFFVRRTQEVPDGGTIDVSIGAPTGSDDPAWTDIEGPPLCQPLGALHPGSRLRIRVAGRPTAFPALVGYYVGLGVVDLEVNEIRGVEQILLSGPQTAAEADATETLWLVDDDTPA